MTLVTSLTQTDALKNADFAYIHFIIISNARIFWGNSSANKSISYPKQNH